MAEKNADRMAEYIANRFKEDQLRKQLTLESENSFKGNR